MTDSIDWERVRDGLARERQRMIWRPYGLPTVASPEFSAFFDGSIAPPWDVPDKLIVSVAITGAFFTHDDNPAQPLAVEEIGRQALDAANAGASTVHIHVRDDDGYNVLSLDRFQRVVQPLREAHPDLSVDGCLVPALAGEWEEMQRALDVKVFDAVPINTTATYVGDALFVKPIPVILEKTRLILESGAMPLIACYTDADVNNAERLLFRSGLMQGPSTWLILPALPGCSPMGNPRQMIEGLTRMASSIYDVDPEATILVCAAGRASSYVVMLAALMGLHVRVGMEDTVWRWPHRDEKIADNLQMLQMASSMAQLLGRDIATPSEYREIVGLPARNGG